MKKSLSEGCARIGQGIILFFFTPINILIWSIVFRLSFSAPALLFAICITALSTLIVFMAFKTADVSLENGVFIIGKLFWTTKISSQRYKKIGTVLPFGYYLEFEDRKRVYVLFGPDEIIKQFTSSKSNEIVEEIKSLIHQELQVKK